MTKRYVSSREHNQLGVTFFRCGAVDLALEQFRLATERAPWVSSYWVNLGVALLDKSLLSEADHALNKALSIDSACQAAHYHLAQLSKKLGDRPAEIINYRMAIESDPTTYLAERAREQIDGPNFRIAWEGVPEKVENDGGSK